MQTWYNAFHFSGQFYEKWMSVRESNINWLLEAVMYMATTETATCIITTEIVMCIMHCRKYHLHDCNRDHLHNFNKIVTHIFAAKIFTSISVADTSSCITATETVAFITATKRSTNISAAESTTNITAIEHQNLHNCYRKCQLHSSNRNCHLQNCLQKLSLAEMVTVRDCFSYTKNIEWISKHQVWGKIILVLLV